MMNNKEALWEMGSEFCDFPRKNEENNLIKDEKTQYVLSGRTGLDLVARDLKMEKSTMIIALPSYCCKSMIDPFLKNGFGVVFYNVCCSEKGLDRIIRINSKFDVILIIDYFGFYNEDTCSVIRDLKSAGKIVIYDDVQSCFTINKARDEADYCISSWRKWFFSCVASVTKLSGTWNALARKTACEDYVTLRYRAAEKKRSYLSNSNGDKETFLSEYRQAEKLIGCDYSGYCADERSLKQLKYLDVDTLCKRRKENAALLYEGVAKLPKEKIRPIFFELDDISVPLFVPVLVNPNYRDRLHEWMCQNNVYCPIHWADPKTGGGKELYQAELSLICDQRYSAGDMNKELSVIEEFFERYA